MVIRSGLTKRCTSTPGRQLFVEKLTTRPYPGFGQVHCEVDKTSLTNFFGRILSVTPDATEIEWVRGLIAKAPPNSISTRNGTDL